MERKALLELSCLSDAIDNNPSSGMLTMGVPCYLMVEQRVF